ncbi:MAG TPA: hypothetical protein VGO34_09700 [Alphaproteobacteria bacterium]|jgi:hypothetical protein
MAISSPIPHSLGALHALGMPFRVVCRSCGYAHDWDLKALIRRHGVDKRWRSVKAQCLRCGARDDEVQVVPMARRLDWAA